MKEWRLKSQTQLSLRKEAEFCACDFKRHSFISPEVMAAERVLPIPGLNAVFERPRHLHQICEA